MMTPQEQQILVAKECGWKRIRELNYVLIGEPPKDHPRWNKSPDGLRGEVPIPWYHEDLNAMYEAEEVLMADYNPVLSSPQRWHSYQCHLMQIIAKRKLWDNGEYLGDKLGFDISSICHASAPQKCEAFCRTCEPKKWKDI